MNKVFLVSLLTAAVALAEIPQPTFPINLESIEYSTFNPTTGELEEKKTETLNRGTSVVPDTDKLYYWIIGKKYGNTMTFTSTYTENGEWIDDHSRSNIPRSTSSRRVSFDKLTRTESVKSSATSGRDKGQSRYKGSVNTVYNENNMPVNTYEIRARSSYFSSYCDTIITHFTYEYSTDNRLKRILKTCNNDSAFHSYSYSDVDGYECITITKMKDDDSTGLVEEKFSPVIKYCTASDTVFEVYNSETKLMEYRSEERYNELGKLVEAIRYDSEDIITSKTVISYTDEGHVDIRQRQTYHKTGELKSLSSKKYCYKNWETTPIQNHSQVHSTLTPALSIANSVLNISFPHSLENRNVKVSIIDYRGRILLEQEGLGSHLQLDLTSLASGPYIAEIKPEGIESVTKSIIKR